MLTEENYCDPFFSFIREMLPLVVLYKQDLITRTYYDSNIDMLIDQRNILLTGGFVD